jgi:hypothetical protein
MPLQSAEGDRDGAVSAGHDSCAVCLELVSLGVYVYYLTSVGFMLKAELWTQYKRV